MMRKKTKMAWSVALSAAMAAGLLAGCGSSDSSSSSTADTTKRKVRVEALQQVLPRQNLLPAIQQIPVTAQPTKLQR